ncbi:MAG: hypothetical protein NDJ24_03185 [Alphaproteobacteria bacterium]|nr:hypothetical protein [Alphaproteobacteria bacterium]
MTSGKTLKSMIKFLYVVAVAVPFLLSACAGSIEPGPMPTGYKHHNGTYKNAPGAEPAAWERNGERHAQSTELAPQDAGHQTATGVESQTLMMTGEAQVWIPAARELVAKIKSRLGQPMEPTFFEGMNGQSVPGFESALKLVTSEQGWPGAASRGSGPFHMSYSVTPADPNDPARQHLTVRLTVSAGNFVIEESGIYTITGASAPVTDPVDLTPVR